jgi:hypothetical protein
MPNEIKSFILNAKIYEDVYNYTKLHIYTEIKTYYYYFSIFFINNLQRFGCALIHTGQLNLKQNQYSKDKRPIDETCICTTCKTYNRSYIHQIVTVETAACHILTVHNIAFQMRLMKEIRQSIIEQRYPKYVQDYMLKVYPNKDYPKWIVNALRAVNIVLL